MLASLHKANSIYRIGTVSISKGGFQFAVAKFLEQAIAKIQQMSDTTFERIAKKYEEAEEQHFSVVDYKIDFREES